jgi:hypothetical protein
MTVLSENDKTKDVVADAPVGKDVEAAADNAEASEGAHKAEDTAADEATKDTTADKKEDKTEEKEGGFKLEDADEDEEGDVEDLGNYFKTLSSILNEMIRNTF